MENYESKRKDDIPESTIVVKWWGVIVLIVGIFGFFFVGFLNHESRITKQETKMEAIMDTLQDIKADTSQIRDKVYNR
jgi:type II secretory pathway component PulF